MDYKQDPPFSIQVEFTEGCSLYCSFCGIQGIRDKVGGYKFMTIETAQRIADEIKRLKWNARIEFAMHGEPSMNPKFIELIRVFRQTLPKHQLMMTSNGSGFIKDGRIQETFDAGLTILALDKYDNCDYVDKALEQQLPVPVHRYPQEPEGNPHRRVKYRFVSVIHDISESDTGTHAQLTNHCGAAFPLTNTSESKRCAKPFRELSIRWDGGVAVCCNDWRGVIDCGNVTTTDLELIWWGMPMQLVRRMLLTAGRMAPPCLGCNATSYRVGLLPDKFGKVKLEPLTVEEKTWINNQQLTKPMAPAILRPWEKNGHGLIPA
jgi:organic radical activating enzyme